MIHQASYVWVRLITHVGLEANQANQKDIMAKDMGAGCSHCLQARISGQVIISCLVDWIKTHCRCIRLFILAMRCLSTSETSPIFWCLINVMCVPIVLHNCHKQTKRKLTNQLIDVTLFFLMWHMTSVIISPFDVHFLTPVYCRYLFSLTFGFPNFPEWQ